MRAGELKAEHGVRVIILFCGSDPPDLPLKMGRGNFDPVLKLYYYKSKWGLLRPPGTNKSNL